jgi:type 1 glutamine amidotransferase
MRTLQVACGAALAAAAGCASATPPADARWIAYPGGSGPGEGKHVVLVSGDEEYRSEEALPCLGKILAERHGFRCTVLFALDPETGEIAPDEQTNVPGLEALATADLAVVFLRFRELPDASMRHFVDYVESGKPLVGILTATHAFQYSRDPESSYARYDWRSEAWPGGFGRQVLGETWVAHHGAHGSESTRGVVVAPDHPIARGVSGAWGPTDVYAVRELPPDATVIVEGEVVAGMGPDDPAVEGAKNDPRMPILWTREQGGRRVVCSTLGAASDLASEGSRRLFVNACYWALGMEDAIRADASVEPVGAYDPTPFGFGGYRRGVRPADHALSR